MSNNTTVSTLVNGRASETFAIADRGLHYGDGVFETAAIQGGIVEFWVRHDARLKQGCNRLGIPLPEPVLLKSEIDTLCFGQTRGVLKVIITRGSGGRGYRPPSGAECQPTRIVQIHPWPDYPASWSDEGVRIRTCQTRLSQQPLLAGIKHLNRLEQVLARREWQDPDIAESIMLDTAERVICGTTSNVFFVRDGLLHTPELSRCGIAGIVRSVVLEIAAALGISTQVGEYSLADLAEADEIFFTNSLIGVWPVRQWDEQQFSPGNVARRIAESLAAWKNRHQGSSD